MVQIKKNRQNKAFVNTEPKAPLVNQDNSNLIIKCLFEGLPLNVAVKGQSSAYITEASHQECWIHPSSVLHQSM